MRANRRKMVALQGFVVLAGLSLIGCTTTTPTSASPSGSGGGGGKGSTPTVSVYLTSGGVETFTYESFAGYPSEVREEGTCTKYSYSKSNANTIDFYGKQTDACISNSLRHAVRVAMSSGKTINGHITCPDCYRVSGRDLSNQYKEVTYSNISRITFNR